VTQRHPQTGPDRENLDIPAESAARSCCTILGATRQHAVIVGCVRPLRAIAGPVRPLLLDQRSARVFGDRSRPDPRGKIRPRVTLMSSAQHPCHCRRRPRLLINATVTCARSSRPPRHFGIDHLSVGRLQGLFGLLRSSDAAAGA
jgi:hypothetical protein